MIFRFIYHHLPSRSCRTLEISNGSLISQINFIHFLFNVKAWWCIFASFVVSIRMLMYSCLYLWQDTSEVHYTSLTLRQWQLMKYGRSHTWLTRLCWNIINEWILLVIFITVKHDFIRNDLENSIGSLIRQRWKSRMFWFLNSKLID